MKTKTRMNVYFDPDLLKKVEALALRRNISKSAVIEAAVASFLSADASERLEAVFARRMDRIGRQIDGLDEDLAIVGETLSLFVEYWMTITPPLPETAHASAKARVGRGSRNSSTRSVGNSRPAIGSSKTCPVTLMHGEITVVIHSHEGLMPPLGEYSIPPIAALSRRYPQDIR